MNPGTSPRRAGSSERRLFWSYHSYSRVARSTGASGFDQERSRWKIGYRRNMPPGESSAESTACSMPSCVRQWLVWSPPGPLPTMTTG